MEKKQLVKPQSIETTENTDVYACESTNDINLFACNTNCPCPNPRCW
ncbi:MAG: hypothetical protein LBO67_06515 [Spirochaetaceae bacterium]|nr:hypothetical protein [Spirochaetaceae bacterium]